MLDRKTTMSDPQIARCYPHTDTVGLSGDDVVLKTERARFQRGRIE